MKVFRIGERVRFIADWADKITPNFGIVSDKKSKNPKCIFVKFDVPSPPANVLMVPIDKLESDE